MMAMNEKCLIFVYGTLKRGQPNFSQLHNSNGSAKFMGCGKTLDKYPLVISSEYNIPFLIYKAGTGHNVEGELIEVDSKMLKHCDDFEGHPNYYERLETSICLTTDENDKPLAEPKTITCWCYCLKKYKPGLLALPFLQNYSSSIQQPYVEKYKRDVCL